jgi:hypothetical protein
MQSKSLLKNRTVSLAAAALCAGLAAYSMIACNSDSGTSPGSDGLIAITSPKSGESFKLGDSMHVKWTVKDDANAPDAVDLQISNDSGKTWIFIRTGSIPNTSIKSWGDYAWVVNSPLPSGLTVDLVGKPVRIRVMQYTTSDPKKIATSGTIAVTAP